MEFKVIGGLFVLIAILFWGVRHHIHELNDRINYLKDWIGVVDTYNYHQQLALDKLVRTLPLEYEDSIKLNSNESITQIRANVRMFNMLKTMANVDTDSEVVDILVGRKLNWLDNDEIITYSNKD